MQQIARKTNENIFRCRSESILKLVAKNFKKTQNFAWHTINELN